MAERRKKNHLYKVLVVGDYAVGKTSLIRRYTMGSFNPNYKLTIGVDFSVKNLDWNEDTTVTLQLWDIAGHERFGHMCSVYYKYAIAAVVVFDVSRAPTLDSALRWKEDVDAKISLADGSPIPFLLCANKCDLPDARMDRAALDHIVKTNGFVAWYATSSKTNTGIDEAMHFLIERIMKVTAMPTAAPQLREDRINIAGGSSEDDGQAANGPTTGRPGGETEKRSNRCC